MVWWQHSNIYYLYYINVRCKNKTPTLKYWDKKNHWHKAINTFKVLLKIVILAKTVLVKYIRWINLVFFVSIHRGLLNPHSFRFQSALKFIFIFSLPRASPQRGNSIQSCLLRMLSSSVLNLSVFHTDLKKCPMQSSGFSSKRKNSVIIHALLDNIYTL